MSPSDLTPLAQRLVGVVVKSLDDAGFVDPDDGCFVDRPYPEGRISTWKRPEAAARPAVVAVLRELIDYVRSEEPLAGTAGYDEGWGDAYAQIANDVEALADSIEKGVE